MSSTEHEGSVFELGHRGPVSSLDRLKSSDVRPAFCDRLLVQPRSCTEFCHVKLTTRKGLPGQGNNLRSILESSSGRFRRKKSRAGSSPACRVHGVLGRAVRQYLNNEYGGCSILVVCATAYLGRNFWANCINVWMSKIVGAQGHLFCCSLRYAKNWRRSVEALMMCPVRCSLERVLFLLNRGQEGFSF